MSIKRFSSPAAFAAGLGSATALAAKLTRKFALVKVDRVTETESPLPPDHLAKRVGGTAGEPFDAQGREIQQYILRSLPENYDFANKRVLDFGCGAGRVLRHFQKEAEKGELVL
jgi:SAM-dependent methyltransferase